MLAQTANSDVDDLYKVSVGNWPLSRLEFSAASSVIEPPFCRWSRWAPDSLLKVINASDRECAFRLQCTLEWTLNAGIFSTDCHIIKGPMARSFYFYLRLFTGLLRQIEFLVKLSGWAFVQIGSPLISRVTPMVISSSLSFSLEKLVHHLFLLAKSRFRCKNYWQWSFKGPPFFYLYGTHFVWRATHLMIQRWPEALATWWIYLGNSDFKSWNGFFDVHATNETSVRDIADICPALSVICAY